MDAYVLYETRFGNTEQVARAVSAALEGRYTVRVAAVADMDAAAVRRADLLVVGAPTEGHGVNPEMRSWLGGFERGSLDGVPVAAFDTRLHMARWLSGSAAKRIAVRLRRAGGQLVAAPESFFVERRGEGDEKETALLAGELERAGAWAATLERAPLAAGVG